MTFVRKNAFLQAIRLEDASLRGAQLEQVDLSRARLSGADLTLANIVASDLSRVDLRCARLANSSLQNCSLQNASLVDCYMPGVQISESNLDGADLSYADLTDANLIDCSLKGTILHFADLALGALTRCDLRGADFRGAGLLNTNWEGSDIGGAILELSCPASVTRESRTTQISLSPLDSSWWRLCSRVGQESIRSRSDSSDLQRVWSAQPEAVWSELKRAGDLLVSPLRANPALRVAYDWLRGQLALRSPVYTGHYPWWGYPDGRPDLRSTHFYCGSDRMVLLELELPITEVTRLNLWAWQNVLWGLPVREDDGDSCSVCMKESPQWPGFPLPQPGRSQLVKSWELALEPDRLAQTAEWGGSPIEAVFEHLRLKDVVSLSFLRPRTLLGEAAFVTMSGV